MPVAKPKVRLKVGKKFLITTSQWFLAPDGAMYRGVWGTIKGVHNDETSLGVRTNARSANWYVEIGNMIVAGCQIHYVIQTDRVNFQRVPDIIDANGERTEVMNLRSLIYNADKKYEP